MYRMFGSIWGDRGSGPPLPGKSQVAIGFLWDTSVEPLEKKEFHMALCMLMTKKMSGPHWWNFLNLHMGIDTALFLN